MFFPLSGLIKYANFTFRFMSKYEHLQKNFHDLSPYPASAILFPTIPLLSKGL